MKKTATRIIAFLLVSAMAFLMTACDFLMPDQEIQLCRDLAVEPETYQAVYGYIANDGTETPIYSMTVDANGSIHYTDYDDVEFYYIKGEDGEYTKYHKYNGEWNTVSGTLNADPKFENSHMPYYMLINDYYYHTFKGKSKKLADVVYQGRDCYAFKITSKKTAGQSWTTTTVKEVYIDKETLMLMKEIIIDYKDPPYPEKTAEMVGTGYACISFTLNPETVVPPAIN